MCHQCVSCEWKGVRDGFRGYVSNRHLHSNKRRLFLEPKNRRLFNMSALEHTPRTSEDRTILSDDRSASPSANARDSIIKEKEPVQDGPSVPAQPQDESTILKGRKLAIVFVAMSVFFIFFFFLQETQRVFPGFSPSSSSHSTRQS